MQSLGQARCSACGRVLQDEESVRLGIGPTCRAKLAARGETPAAPASTFDPAVHNIRLWRDEGDEPHANIEQRIKYHSPSGFEWGYEGSGPADLALNILDRFLPASERNGVELVKAGDRLVDARAFDLHQPFKRAFIAPMLYDGGIITNAAITQWIDHELARRELAPRKRAA